MKKNKIFGFLLLLLIIISTAYSVGFVYEQDRVIADRTLDDLGNTQLYDLVGSISSSNATVKTLGNQTGDLKFDFPSLARDTYIIINNPTVNSTIDFSYSVLDSEGYLSTVISQELTMQETGNYYFKLEPDFVGEPVLLLIDVNDSYVTTLNIQSSMPMGMNFVFETFVTGMNDIIEINVSIWRLGFYLLISGVIITAIMLMVNTALKIFEITEKVRKTKDKVLGRKRRE